MCERISLKKAGITGVFCGGTEMTPQFHRFAVEELMEGAHFAPTYGNTLMGLGPSKPPAKEDNWAIIYYPPAPRAMIEVVDPDDPWKLVDYGTTGRTRLTTLTKEFFMPRFLERDECERERPCEQYPWDGVRNVRPFSRFQKSVVEGRLLGHQAIRPGIRPSGIDTHAAFADSSLGRPVSQRQPGGDAALPHARAVRVDEPGEPRADSARPAEAGRDARASCSRFPYADLVAMAGRAAEHFLNDTLPLDPESGTTQTPQQYIEQVSATTGMPFSNVRRNMLKVHGVLEQGRRSARRA